MLFERIDPVNKFLWIIFLGISLLFFETPFFGIMVFIGIIIILIFGTNISLYENRKRLLLIFLIPSSLFVFHLLIQPGKKVIDLYLFSITDKGLKTGVLYFFRFASVISASFLFILTTDIRQFMVGLVRIGLPYQLAFVIFLMLRFVPIISDELAITRDAFKIRGLVKQSGIKRKIYLWKRYLFTSIVKGIRSAEKTSIAMESRAFNAYKKRTFITDFKWSFYGFFLNILYISFTLIYIFWI